MYCIHLARLLLDLQQSISEDICGKVPRNFTRCSLMSGLTSTTRWCIYARVHGWHSWCIYTRDC